MAMVVSLMNMRWPTFFGLGAAYGALRKVTRVNRMTIDNHWSWEKHDARPLLMSEKVSVIVCGAAVCSVYLPFYVVKDLVTTEMILRGMDADRYGYTVYRHSGLFDAITS